MERKFYLLVSFITTKKIYIILEKNIESPVSPAEYFLLIHTELITNMVFWKSLPLPFHHKAIQTTSLTKLKMAIQNLFDFLQNYWVSHL